MRWLICIKFLCLLSTILCRDKNDTFLYFAYGSNLLRVRILINNPTAESAGVAELKGYRLDFNMQSDSWNGAVATIVRDPASSVWGVLWRLNIADMKHLDEQEGVDKGEYYAKNVTVKALNGTEYVARTYIETHNPTADTTIFENHILPVDRQPSSTYLAVITYGAAESGLPAEYIGNLLIFNSNGQLAEEKIRKQLGYPFY